MTSQKDVRFRNTVFLSVCHLIRNWTPIQWTLCDRIHENRHQNYATCDLSNFLIPDLQATTTRKKYVHLLWGWATEQQHGLSSATVSRPTNWNPSVLYSLITGHYFTGDEGLYYLLQARLIMSGPRSPFAVGACGTVLW